MTLAILDTPGAEGAASSAAMQVADLNIVPSRPSLFDLWASARTRAALAEIGAEFVFLLNQCPAAQQTARVQDGVETLGEMGELISPLILTRVDYPEAARRGWGVTELNPYGAAAQEMRDFWQSINRRLALAKIRTDRGGGVGRSKSSRLALGKASERQSSRPHALTPRQAPETAAVAKNSRTQ